MRSPYLVSALSVREHSGRNPRRHAASNAGGLSRLWQRLTDDGRVR